MCNWRLKFRGDESGLSFNDVISQVEMKACGQNMDSEEILYEFYEFWRGHFMNFGFIGKSKIECKDQMKMLEWIETFLRQSNSRRTLRISVEKL